MAMANRTTDIAHIGQHSPAGEVEKTRQNGRPGRALRTRLRPAATQAGGRVRVDGKFFAAGGRRFDFRGVTYGTFEPRTDGARFPERIRIERDMKMMREAGLTVVRTYTLPTEDLLEAAADQGLRVLAGIFYPDWRYLLGGSRRQMRKVVREASREVAEAAGRLSGDERILGLSLGNEVPADVLRWYGTEVVADTIRNLVELVREEDAEQLVTYANYPTAEYLPLESLDFLMFNVFLERRPDFRRYLTRLHHLAGDRPLVLSEVGLHAGSGPDAEREQAEVLSWQLETAIERGVAGTCIFSWTDDWFVGDERVTGWRFGLTREDRSPRPALDVARHWNRRTVRNLNFNWPSISVVICAHNSAATLDECLRHTCALDYPDLEVIVVDDGSSDASPQIAARYPEARLVQIAHSGLAAARNEGLRAAAGDLIAYLDSDAFPAPEWPYYLALGLDASDVGGVGGPNLPPPEDPLGAQAVARSPGGPVHVLTSDDRAEHVPGCNMAFWKLVLTEVGGFDPVYRIAGDDVDLCWKVQDRNWKLGFHPAAVVWHHRRPGLGVYLRQQHEYGKAEALVEARHPERFTATGTARWRGHIYNSLVPSLTAQRIYRGVYGSAAYQSVYRVGGHALDLLHQLGVPLATVLVLTAPAAEISPLLGLPAVVALAFLVGLALVDASRVQPPRRHDRTGLGFRARVMIHHLLQPLVRTWGRARHRQEARRDLEPPQALPPAVSLASGVVVLEEDRPRADLVAAVVNRLRRRGVRATQPSGWEDYDSRLLLSPLIHCDLQTSSHPEGFVQMRIRLRPRLLLAVLVATVAVAALVINPWLWLLLLVPAWSAGRAVVLARRLPAAIVEPAEPQPESG
jgi:hypothetical protein